MRGGTVRLTGLTGSAKTRLAGRLSRGLLGRWILAAEVTGFRAVLLMEQKACNPGIPWHHPGWACRRHAAIGRM